ncbi:histidine kinase dimerization/phosphoacceptor domain -containing protein [Arcobacter sp. s6]|uniref:histidine kinase dimerization/phosphoacceptor domain -containing protein n=1 Tax=Arcobacter sp. s6 TaxID=3230363 RepID=UPI0034A02A1B
MANIKNIPISFKIGFSFLLISLFLLTILFILLIPKIEKEQYNNALLQTEKIVLLTKYQIDLVVDYFKYYNIFEKNESKIKISNQIEQIKLKSEFDTKYIEKNLIEDLRNINTNYNCQITLSKNSENILNLKNDKVKKSFDFKNTKYDEWENISLKNNLCPAPSYYLFKTIINNNELKLTCSSYFENSYTNIENDVKEIVQNGFSLSENIHKGKIYLMWINKEIDKNNLDKSLDTINNDNNQNYCVSKISNYRVPKSGELTINDILEVKNTKNIKHKIDNKDTLTWISKIYENENEKFVFVLSAFEDDFINDINSPIVKILPISILALILSILFGYFLFKKWIKDIEKLSTTAKQVCLGKLNFRSNIKGNDDIGILGIAFDSMLDKIEDNIKTLDYKVEERTTELTNSLQSKELLLKEIHHRVKNNLALTINFIKLQKFKINDKNIVNALTSIENRVYTMALLHTKLYESTNLDSINFNIYINQLIKDIKTTFEENLDVSIIIDVEDIFLDIDQAMPCGLIINECVVNALKYAFIDNNGILEIRFKKSNSEYILEIKDNGIGLKKDFKIEELTSLGLSLVNSIANTQLYGNLEIKKEIGTHLIIKFPLI